MYTKNPESSGGFNGAQTGVPLVGMWQNTADPNDCLAFNGDGEWFMSGKKNTSGKIWWDFYGPYEYNPTTKLLVLGNSVRDTDNDVYTVEQPFATQIKLKDEDGEVTTYQKRDSL